MTEKKPTKKPEEAATEETAEQAVEPAQDAETPVPEKSGGVTGPLALVTVLVLAILVGGAAWHFHQQLLALQNEQSGFASAGQLQALDEAQDERMGEIAGRVETLNSALDSRLEAIARLENRMTDQRESAQVLADRVDQLYRRMQSENDDWRIAEAAYLGRIALHRLQFNDDVAGALEALEAADTLLAGLGGSGVDRREAIARATDRLLEVSPPDKAGIHRSLSRLADSLPELPLAEGLQTGTAAAEEQAGPASGGMVEDWSARAERAWGRLREGLSELVVISRNREVAPLPDPESRFLLQQNLMLQVETARLAALRGEADVYAQSIARIQAWVDAYFDSASEAVAAVNERLDELAAESVAFTPPAIADDLAPLFDGNATP